MSGRKTKNAHGLHRSESGRKVLRELLCIAIVDDGTRESQAVGSARRIIHCQARASIRGRILISDNLAQSLQERDSRGMEKNAASEYTFCALEVPVNWITTVLSEGTLAMNLWDDDETVRKAMEGHDDGKWISDRQ